MLKQFFKHTGLFTLVFFILLATDIYFKIHPELVSYRFFTKPLLTLLLIGFYWSNSKDKSNAKKYYVLVALSLFLIGDILLILYEIQWCYILGMLLYIVAKLFYVFRFSNQKDFNLIRLLPFLLISFIYILGLLNLTYDNLGDYFLPVLIYVFVALLTVLFSVLRKGVVNKLSYWLVLSGVFIAIISDSITVLQSFYWADFPYHKISIMLFYAVSQYLIINGLVVETKSKV